MRLSREECVVKRGRSMKVAGTLGVGVALAIAVPVFACTSLPSISLSQAYGPAGDSVQVTGTAWAPSFGRVTLRWGSLSGPVIATAVPDAAGTLGAVTITIPTSARPGLHAVIASTDDVSSPARAVFQVLSPSGSAAPPPVEALPYGPVGRPAMPVGTSTMALVAVCGLVGLGALGIGASVLAGSHLRHPSPSRVPRR